MGHMTATKNTASLLLALSLIGLLLAGLALANGQSADSLYVRQVDWIDAAGYPMAYGALDDEFFFHRSKAYWDLSMGDSFLVWIPGSDRILFVDAMNSSSVDTIANFDYGSVNATGVTICDSISYIGGRFMLLYIGMTH